MLAGLNVAPSARQWRANVTPKRRFSIDCLGRALAQSSAMYVPCHPNLSRAAASWPHRVVRLTRTTLGRGAALLRAILRWAWWLPCLWWTLPAQAEVLELHAAQRTAVSNVAPDATPDWRHARQVSLPDRWDEGRPDDPATTVSGSRWYRVTLDRIPDAGELLGLYAERACSVMQVHLNGHLVYGGGATHEPVSRQCSYPQLVTLPAALLLPQGNALDLRVTGYALDEVAAAQRAGGLSILEIGPYEVLRQHQRRRMFYAVQLPQVMSGALLLMGSFMFVMGWFNRAQSYLAYFGALMIGCAISLARLWWTDLPWSNHMTELLLSALLGFITLAAVQFMLRYAGQRRVWLDRGLPAQCLVVAASLVVAGGPLLHSVSIGWEIVLWLEIVVTAGYCLRLWLKRRSRQSALMGVLLGIVGLALATDFAAQQFHLDERIAYVAQLVPSLVFLVLGLRLTQQFGRAYQSVEQSRNELELRIREATAQIERNFAQLSELRVEQVTDRERKRIAADLHDDLGAKLLTIVHTSDSERISTLAREALEEMRLSVRGLTGKPVKLLDALGDWRAEVVSRLTQSGVRSEWSAPSDDELPQTLSSRAYVQTTRILREAVSNIIKHSRASHCALAFTLHDGDFHLVIRDNGQGISTELEGRLDKGHGMASMKGRAKQLQGQCLVESNPGHGTVIRLTLPLDRHVTAR